MTGRLHALHHTVLIGGVILSVYVFTLMAAGGASFVLPLFDHTATYRTIVLMGVPVALAVGLALWHGGRESGADLAFKDELTGLANRRAFVASSQKALEHAAAGCVGIVLYDVDGLKTINDCCGHQAGDELLRLAGAYLVRRSALAGTAYRIGGDEFAILVDRTRGGRMTRVVQSIKVFEAPFSSCGHVHQVRMSAGYASINDDESFDSLFRRADARLRANKERLYKTRPVPRRTLAPITTPVPPTFMTELARPEVLRENLRIIQQPVIAATVIETTEVSF